MIGGKTPRHILGGKTPIQASALRRAAYTTSCRLPSEVTLRSSAHVEDGYTFDYKSSRRDCGTCRDSSLDVVQDRATYGLAPRVNTPEEV